jgi:hypothetical protein
MTYLIIFILAGILFLLNLMVLYKNPKMIALSLIFNAILLLGFYYPGGEVDAKSSKDCPNCNKCPECKNCPVCPECKECDKCENCLECPKFPDQPPQNRESPEIRKDIFSSPYNFTQTDKLEDGEVLAQYIVSEYNPYDFSKKMVNTSDFVNDILDKFGEDGDILILSSDFYTFGDNWGGTIKDKIEDAKNNNKQLYIVIYVDRWEVSGDSRDKSCPKCCKDGEIAPDCKYENKDPECAPRERSVDEKGRRNTCMSVQDFLNDVNYNDNKDYFIVIDQPLQINNSDSTSRDAPFHNHRHAVCYFSITNNICATFKGSWNLTPGESTDEYLNTGQRESGIALYGKFTQDFFKSEFIQNINWVNIMIGFNVVEYSEDLMNYLLGICKKLGIVLDQYNRPLYPKSPDIVTMYWSFIDYSSAENYGKSVIGVDRNVRLSTGISPPSTFDKNFKGVGIDPNMEVYIGTDYYCNDQTDFFKNCTKRIKFKDDLDWYVKNYSGDLSYTYPWNYAYNNLNPPSQDERLYCKKGDNCIPGKDINSCFDVCTNNKGAKFNCVNRNVETNVADKSYTPDGSGVCQYNGDTSTNCIKCQKVIKKWNNNGNWSGALMSKFFQNAIKGGDKYSYINVMMYGLFYETNIPCSMVTKTPGCFDYPDQLKGGWPEYIASFAPTPSGIIDFVLKGKNRNVKIIEGQTMDSITQNKPNFNMFEAANKEASRDNSKILFKLFNTGKSIPSGECTLNNPPTPKPKCTTLNDCGKLNGCCNRDHTKMYFSDYDVLICAGHPYNGSELDWDGINESLLIENSPNLCKMFNQIFNVYWKSSYTMKECDWDVNSSLNG